MRGFALLLVAGLSSAAAASAQTEGINLSWNDCGAAGQSVESFACNTNTGVHTLVASFVAPPGVTQFTGIEALLWIDAASASVPSWWTIYTLGDACRSGVYLGFGLVPGSPCEDPWLGQALGGMEIVPFALDPTGPRVQARIVGTLAGARALVSGNEYVAFLLNIPNGRAVGDSACEGCRVGAGIYLEQVRLAQAPGVGDSTLTVAPAAGRQFVSWQCPATPTREYGRFGEFTGVRWSFDASCVTPTRRPTWGSIKALYR